MPTPSGGFRDYGRDDEGKLKVYKHRLRLADEKFNSFKDIAYDHWGRYRHRPKESQFTPPGHRVVTSVGIGVIDAMFSSLTAVDVDIVVKNVGTGTRDQARIAEAAIAEVWREQKVQRKAERAIKDALVAPGIGWMKVAYDYVEEEVERERSQEDIEADVDALFEAWRAENETRAAAGKPPTEPPTPDEIAMRVPMTERVIQVRRDRIVIDYVPWEDVRWDPAAKHVDDIRWMAQYTRLPIDEVRTNPAFLDYMRIYYGERKTKKFMEELQPDSTIRTRDHEKAEATPDDDRVTIVEFYDFDTGTICTFPKNADFKLNEAANPFAVNDDLEDKNPFVPLILRMDGQDVRGISDMELMAPTLDELQNLRSDLDTYISRSIPKLLGPEGALTEAGKAALQSREWGAYVELTAGATSSDIDSLKPPVLPQEVFGIPEKLVQEIREATGSSELHRGLFPQTRQTATTTLAVQTAGDIRQAEKRNRLENFYIDLARRTLFLIQVFYDAERISRLIELDRDVEWYWNAEDVVMEAKLECHLSPKEAITKQSRRDTALSWVNLLAPLPFIDLPALVKWGLEESGFDLETIRSFIKTEAEVSQDVLSGPQPPTGTEGVPGDLSAMLGLSPAEVPAGAEAGPQGPEAVSNMTTPLPGEMPPA